MNFRNETLRVTQKILPLDVRLKIYERAKGMRRQGFTYKKISNTLSKRYHIKIPKDTIYHWISDRNRPDGVFNKFIPKPSPELSYVIGVFLGDGYLKIEPKNYRYVIRLKVKDKEFAEEFSRTLAKILHKDKPYLIWKENDYTRGNRSRYTALAGSKLLFNFLSKPLDGLLFYVKPFYAEFLRGLFDSDGFTAISATKNFNVKLGLVNTDLRLLKYVKKILEYKFNIHSSIISTKQKGKIKIIWNKSYIAKKEVYCLTIHKFSDVIKFIGKIKFSIKRKQEKMLDAIFIKQNFNSQEAVIRWKEFYTKVGREWVKINMNSGDSPEFSFR